MIKNYLLALICVVPFLSSLQSMSASTVRTSKYRRAAEDKKLGKKIKKGPNHLGSNLGTEFQFNDLSVRGRYQGAFQGVATVENEKNPTRLIDYRKDYKDRLSVSGSDL